jgi:cell wall-associated NlpC family hydrolase
LNGSKNSSAKTGQPAATAAHDVSKAPARPSFALQSTTVDLDPRIHAYRDDIADIALADRIALPHYVAPVARRIGLPVVNLYADPSETSELGSQLLYGEGFALLDTIEGWAWGYGLHDHFVGFLRTDALVAAGETTHIVSAVSTSFAAGRADGASATLFLGARIAGTAEGDRLVTENGSVPLADVRTIDDHAGDPVAIAEMLIDAPYLLGGRSAKGIDCSGLVQLSFGMAGHRLERDSDLQQVSAGEPLADDAELRRGDLIFFPEHVGLMVDGETLIHASGHNGKTCTEPLAEVIARIAEKHDKPVLASRRIAG